MKINAEKVFKRVELNIDKDEKYIFKKLISPTMGVTHDMCEIMKKATKVEMFTMWRFLKVGYRIVFDKGEMLIYMSTETTDTNKMLSKLIENNRI